MNKRNENRPGYRETKVGWIPEDWKSEHLASVVDMNRESLSEGNTEDNYSFYYLTLSDVSEGNFYKPEKKFRFYLAPSRARRKFTKGDILLSTVRPNLKGFGFVDFNAKEFICSTGFAVLHPKNKFDGEFIYHYLYSYNADKYFYACVVGSNYPALNNNDVEKLWIPLPPEKERTKIAEILTTWDTAIDLVGKQIEAKQRLKKGLMQQLLTGKIRFPGFGKPVVGNELPEGWRAFRMCELGEQYSGLKGKSKEDFCVGKPYIPYLNIFQNNVINSRNLDYVQIENGENQNAVKKGDMFFTLSSETPEEVGMSSVLLEDIGECYLNSFCMGFRLLSYSFLHPDYAVTLFRGPAFRRDIFKYAQGSTRFNLSKNGFMKMIIKIPDITEQRRIAELYFCIDKEISILTKRVQSLQIQKQGLIQKLLAGEVRVKV